MQQNCPNCHGQGFIRTTVDGYEVVKRCACSRWKVWAQAKFHANIPKIFHKVTLRENPDDGRETYKVTGGRDLVARKHQEEALALCRRLRDTYAKVFLEHHEVDDLYGLMLFGACGVGKTRLVCSLLDDLIHMGLTDVRFIEYTELFKQIRFSFNNSEVSYQSIFEGLIKAKVLVIDDFATEVSGNLVWVLDNIGYIINERYNLNLPTILTSNYWVSTKEQRSESDAKANPFETHKSWELKSAYDSMAVQEDHQRFQQELHARVNYRLRSRIREMCYEMEIKGHDFRKKIGRNRELLMEKRKRDDQRKKSSFS